MPNFEVVQLRALLKLKSWLTLRDAASYLSILLGEDVTEADILGLGLDGRLTLSVSFLNFTLGRIGKIIPYNEADLIPDESPDEEGRMTVINGIQLDKDRVLSFTYTHGNIIEGIWDLAMEGDERYDVEDKYQQLVDGPEVKLRSGDRLVNRTDGTWACVDFLGTALGVRTSSLQDLEARLAEPAADRPLGLRERTTLLTIIAALANLADIEFTKPSKAALTIESETIRMGARVAARTIEDHLNRIRDALESKAD